MLFTRVRVLFYKFRRLLFRLLNSLNLLLFSFGVDTFAKLTKNIISFERIQNSFGLRFKFYFFFLLLRGFVNVPFLFLKILIEPTESKAKWFLFLFLNLLYFFYCFRRYLFVYYIKGISCIPNTTYLFYFLLILLLLLYFSHFLLDCFLLKPMRLRFLSFILLERL